jgi:hypothetical protein
MLFITIGTLDSGSTQSNTDSSKRQRVRHHEINVEGVEGEAESTEDGNNHQGMRMHDYYEAYE